jgi:hypothetical protein
VYDRTEVWKSRGCLGWWYVNWIDLLQWPAMVASVLAAWLVASKRERRRKWGFWVFLLSNVLWVVWGWRDHAYAIVALQVCLAALNIRGVAKAKAQEMEA